MIEVVEIGCGPGNMFELVGKNKNISITAIDIDSKFLDVARSVANNNNLPIIIKSADIKNYKHNKPVNLFYSIGVHQHLPKIK